MTLGGFFFFNKTQVSVSGTEYPSYPELLKFEGFGVLFKILLRRAFLLFLQLSRNSYLMRVDGSLSQLSICPMLKLYLPFIMRWVDTFMQLCELFYICRYLSIHIIVWSFSKLDVWQIYLIIRYLMKFITKLFNFIFSNY